MMFSIKFFLGLIFTFTFNLSMAKVEYLPKSQLSEKVQNSFLWKDCGSTRIHDKIQIYISALHCVSKHIGSYLNNETFTIKGNPIIGDETVFSYSYPESKNIEFNGKKVLAWGGCFTGFSLDLISRATNSEISRATDCLQKDWVIYEVVDVEIAFLSDPPSSCLKANLKTTDQQQVRPIGRTSNTMYVFRDDQPVNVIQHGAYSVGYIDYNVWDSKSKGYEFTDFWVEKMINEVSSLIENGSVIISSGEVIDGFSGGAILNENDEIVGINTVLLIPGRSSPEMNYLYGTHFGVTIAGVKKQMIQQNNENIIKTSFEEVFDCNEQ